MTSRDDADDTDPKPLLKGYSAAYRAKLEQEFFGSEHGSRVGRIPHWMGEGISRLLKEIENSRAALRAAPPSSERAVALHAALVYWLPDEADMLRDFPQTDEACRQHWKLWHEANTLAATLPQSEEKPK